MFNLSVNTKFVNIYKVLWFILFSKYTTDIKNTNDNAFKHINPLKTKRYVMLHKVENKVQKL